MGTILLQVSVVSIISYNMHLLQINAIEIIYNIFAESTGMLLCYSQIMEECSYWTPLFLRRVDTKNLYPSSTC
jgi:hypothetical protein